MQNPFEILGIAPKFDLDAGELKRLYFKRSREFHPDYHTGASDVEQEAMLLQSSALNKAYEALRQPAERMEAILRLHDMLDSEGQTQLPQTFLMEMMDINEAIMDLQMDPDAAKQAKVMTQVESFEADLKASIAENMKAYDQDGQAEHLVAVKEYYYKAKYLYRIKENLDTFAS